MLQPLYLGLLFIYHINIGISFQFSLTFEVTNLKNAIECSYNQLVQSNAFKIVRSRYGINYFVLLHLLVLLSFSCILCIQKLGV